MEQLKFYIIIDYFGFPNGMASTQRVKLIAKSLIKYGAIVKILCLRPTENSFNVENYEASGNYEGIDFEYTSGTTIVKKRKIHRYWTNFVGIWNAAKQIVRNDISCLYFYFPSTKITFAAIIFRVIGKILHIPIILEQCEQNWKMLGKSFFSKLVSPLFFIDGVITISHYLSDWIISEKAQSQKEVQIFYLPIIVDPLEFNDINLHEKSPIPTVLFASSPRYLSTIEFVIEAMKFVWSKRPNCVLVLTGMHNSDQVSAAIKNKYISTYPNIKTVYLEREILFELYRNSWVLLIPLFNDVRSMSRFPTKIGEYLLSATPVVTTSIGEIKYFLEDGKNAYVCKADDPLLFGSKILEAIENGDTSKRIGEAGKNTAFKEFAIENHEKRIYDFFTMIANK